MSWLPWSKAVSYLGLSLFLAACAAPTSSERNDAQGAKRIQLPELANSKPSATTQDEVSKILRTSVHSKLDCADCHSPKSNDGAPTAGSQAAIGQARCDHCHIEQGKAYTQSVHAGIENKGQTRAAVCAQCHGDHDILPVNDPGSRVGKLQVAKMCSACHESPEAAPRLRANGASAGTHYLESIHGRALMTKGLTVAPSCTDCHGKAHQLRWSNDPKSPVSHDNVKDTCGKCHAGVEEQFKLSEHAKALANGSDKAPTCPTCHTAHDISAAAGNFKLQSDKVCGKCHEKRRDQYLDTYHGRAHALGDATVAACFDCHGTHAIIRTSDPRSTLSTQNRVATCRKCHANASASFAKFMPHADHGDRQNYPVLYWTFIAMTGLLIGTFGFFGIHTLFWFMRSMVLYFQDRPRFQELKKQSKLSKKARIYQRFRPVDRFCHILIIISFLLLVATGMPLKFSHAPWAAQIFDLLGGVKAAGRLHRFGAMITFTYFAIHILSMIGPIRSRRDQYTTNGKFDLKKFFFFVFGPDSPAPNLQDLRDFIAHSKWFIGKGPRPTFDRFTYWEKFDYMAVFWGVSVIGLSGLVMWFPQETTRFLPGWAINIAQIIHSDEALLAAGFIFTFHFFNGHFRPEKFPLDPVIFSGRITESEMMHERGRQYERMQKSGELEALETTSDEWESWKWLFTPFGATALVIGVSLVIAIFWALTH